MWIKKLIPAYIQIKSLYTIQQEKILDKELTNLFYLIDTDKYYDAKRVLETLRKLNIPVVNHKVETVFVEPEELRVKADVVAEGFVLFATRNNDKLFVPNKRPEEGDLSGMISLDGKKAKPIENVLSIMNFGYWELV